jgi:hypothetical protein
MSKSRGTHAHFLLSKILDAPPPPRGLVLMYLRNRVTHLYTQALGSLFVASCDSQGYGGVIRPSLRMSWPKTRVRVRVRVELELLYDWRFTVLATSPLRPTTRIVIFQPNTCGYSPYVTSSLTRGMGPSFTIAAGPRQRSHSQVRVPRDS